MERDSNRTVYNRVNEVGVLVHMIIEPQCDSCGSGFLRLIEQVSVYRTQKESLTLKQLGLHCKDLNRVTSPGE